MRLTAELITNSLSYNNPLNERELDLRVDTINSFIQGHKIPAIENLGVAKDSECIDFTDNNIAQLNNFPLSTRLQSLLCAQNRISSISDSLPKSLPNLHTLVLTNNNMQELADLDALQGLTKLTYLSLKGNPVENRENYRYYILWRCPQIRFLDFQKVKDAERAKARELFGSKDAPTELAQSILASRSKGTTFGSAPLANGASKGGKMKVTEEERKRFQILVKRATTLSEVQRLEKAFNKGRLPAGVMDGDLMDET